MGEAIAKLNYSHEAMIDLIVANPMITQGELAQHFQYTPGWICQIMQSDAFRERLAARKGEMTDPLVLQSVEKRFEALVTRSQEILQSKLDGPNPPTELALKVVEVSSRALGYGARQQGPQVNVGFVVQMPQKAADANEWIAAHKPRPAITIDSTITEKTGTDGA